MFSSYSIKRKIIFFTLSFLALMFCVSLVVFAQTPGDIPIFDTGNPLLNQLLPYLFTAIVIPFIVSGVKWLAPQIPKKLIPFIVIIIGGVSPVLISLVQTNGMKWYIMAAISILSIGLYELKGAIAAMINPPTASQQLK